MVVATPKSPEARLAQLDGFVKSWLADNIAPRRPQRAENLQNSGLNRMVAKLSAAYTKCGFFDPEVEHGGPRPESARRRRSDEEIWAGQELEDLQEMIAANPELDVFESNLSNEERGLQVDMRLSAEPDLALKQITTGLKKWALRYVAECPGEDKAMTQSNRLVKVFHHRFQLIFIFIPYINKVKDSIWYNIIIFLVYIESQRRQGPCGYIISTVRRLCHTLSSTTKLSSI